ncbi:MAG: hypothetical protein OEY14_17410 [Myxococcales bacterium]|nr:hypothetical protein [Myxococcales bacterium]
MKKVKEKVPIVSKPGRIVSVDFGKSQACVKVGGKVLPFELTSFHSGWPTRHPTEGDSVSVRFGKKGTALLSVRLRDT